MQFERIRKNHKRKIIIGGLILVCVISAITITTTRAKYKITQDISLVKGTINYKQYDFKMMAMYKSEDGANYTEINEMPKGYIINEERTYCTIDNKTQVKGKIKTINGEHIIENLKKSDKCYIYFDKYRNERTVLGTLKVNYEIPDFSKMATTDEGIYGIYDEIYNGYSYYWRGASATNYLKFGGFCWRIIRINGDGSLRLIYDGSTCHANGTSTADSIAVADTKYSTSFTHSNYVGWTYSGTSQRTLSGTSSNAKTQIDKWYNANITGINADKVADGKFCNDRNVASGYTWVISPSSTFYYAGYDRSGAKSASSVNPTLACNSGDVYTLKVGAITVDEIVMAGAKYETTNSTYYLYNGQNYWTMSPYDSFFRTTDSSILNSMFIVRNEGKFNRASISGVGIGLRPVINLNSDTQLQGGGTGTQNNPYVVI